MANEKKPGTSSDAIILFIQKYRKALLAFLILAAAGLIGSLAFFSIRSVMQRKAIVTLEAFEKRMEALNVNDPGSALETESLVAEINNFASSAFGYASARAYSLAADIHFSRSEWALAEEAWLASAHKASRMYLAPLSLYNAAAAAEEQGKLDDAIDYYKQSLDYKGIFSGASRARFNIARIYEAKNDKTAAAAAYRDLVEKAPEESNWAKLAQSRIIFLENK